MLNELPADRQTVEVRFNADDWQPAIFRAGQFVDMYGLTLDQEKIADWRAMDRDLPPPAPRHRGWILP